MTNVYMSRRSILTALIAASTMVAAACSDDGTLPKLGGSSETGTVVVKLTDAPFPTDQVQSVDIFVVRVDGRVSDVTAVSYTHLTLPTSDLVHISVVAVSL